MTLALPADGVFTRSAFDRLHKPPDSWAWELRDGRLELTYRPVSFWHSRIMLMLISFWLGEGHEAATEQYIGPEVDGLISMYELLGGEYELIRTVTASELRK
jgi:hypothetical protein